MYVRLAFRNVWRNKARSLITLGAIAFGCISLIVAGGFIEDTFVQMRESYIRSYLGHLQVYKKGFMEKGASNPFKYSISEPEELIGKLSSVEHVKRLTPRIEFSGLLSTGETTVSFLGQGVDPLGERNISTFVELDSGSNLDEGDGYGIILGRGLASSIGARVGDPLVVVANTRGGSINGLDVTVRGIFFTSSKAFDDRTVRMPIRTAQKLLQTGDVQSIVVLLDETGNTDAVRDRLKAAFEAEGLGLEIVAWHEMADFYTKTVALYERQFFVLKLIIAVIVVLSIFNTMNMSVLERIGEVGTVMALGTKSSDVVMLFVIEGLILGVLGGAAGLAGGYGAAALISHIGIPMPPPPGATIYWTAAIRVVPGVFLYSFALAIATSLLSSFYPAYKASRLEIAEALRHNV